MTSGYSSHGSDYLWSLLKRLITAGLSSNGCDYYWSLLTLKWLPLVTPHTEVITSVTPHTEVITSGHPSYSSYSLWSSLRHKWLPVVTPHTVVITTGTPSHGSHLWKVVNTWVVTSSHPSHSRDLSHTLMSGKIELLTDRWVTSDIVMSKLKHDFFSSLIKEF